ncbi:cobalamin B12-binding domain-containing protein [Sulfitobacter guttiformis]|uniref:Methanogenic corrinoid protein MtbC1 n=1 Tax=Sulfitobacter guttiformis TaxID=74349 RepID=J7G091_9RHOB|nr:cobalamin-dependent protein [Sulfitobacter guttiformis]AFP55422.1 regulatory protein PpaA [Sulfitobacter guttiformis]KIN75451.1 Regulatory protein PpaA [Sulfitobacter guttiformis KCTC 32187]RKE92044.1 methanogenic corrinoid protein MtbC1 [Sulfitobacter guttiformis]
MLKDTTIGPAVPSLVVGGVARQILSVLSSELRLIYPDMPARALVRYLDEMQAALTQPNPKNITKLLNDMRRSGIRDADIADFYIPVVARRLGEGWVSDDMEFTQVTVGMANLQTMLRTLDSSWCMPERAPFGTLGEICIIVPQGVQHSLGSSILAGQMRRAGYDVHLGADIALERIAQFVSSPATVGVMLSASLWEPLDFLKAVVKKIRQGNPWAPVLVGGNILELECDVSALIGADHAMNDWQAALSFCAQRVQP